MYDKRIKSKRDGIATLIDFYAIILSFVFGSQDDSDEEADEIRWRNAAWMIRNCGGTNIAEQLRPLLDPGHGFALHSPLNASQSFMFPVLRRFNGIPELTEDGTLVYVFPDLMKSATRVGYVGTTTSRRLSIEERSTIFIEPLKRLSLLTFWEKLLAGIYGILNFCGMIKLGMLLSEPAILIKNTSQN
eukprot:CAMPEP_0182447728 /NCGR_PEP_ID=MMETSP1172-20130603/19473_1 /TAXON_ID=708627 /ORGANISM="Timspurckia oligopyrenoides, Strain CCMP3278" /LENGTH=187 /DNA_ID=CAMNT_0024644275 /DNA_START=692 /DNA_END=1256 /DNA_ORIENTATION=+